MLSLLSCSTRVVHKYQWSVVELCNEPAKRKENSDYAEHSTRAQLLEQIFKFLQIYLLNV